MAVVPTCLPLFPAIFVVLVSIDIIDISTHCSCQISHDCFDYYFFPPGHLSIILNDVNDDTLLFSYF